MILLIYEIFEKDREILSNMSPEFPSCHLNAGSYRRLLRL